MRVLHLILCIYYGIQFGCGYVTFFETDQNVHIFVNSSLIDVSRTSILILECRNCIIHKVYCEYCDLDYITTIYVQVAYTLPENSLIFSELKVDYLLNKMPDLYNTSHLVIFQKSRHHVIEYRMVQYDDVIQCHPNYTTISFICLNDRKYDFMPTEVMFYKNFKLKFNSFAPQFNYSCNCAYVKLSVNIISFIVLNLQKIPEIQSCEIPEPYYQVSFWILLMNTTVFCIYIGAYLLAAFLVTDGVFKYSIQSDLMDKLGFSKAWGSDDMTMPPFIVIDKDDGEERFKKIIELTKETDKKIDKMRFLNRPTTENYKYMFNLVKDRHFRNSIRYKKSQEVHFKLDLRRNPRYPKNPRFQETKRDIILRELRKRKMVREQTRFQNRTFGSLESKELKFVMPKSGPRTSQLEIYRHHLYTQASPESMEDKKFTIALPDMYASNKPGRTLMTRKTSLETIEKSRRFARMKKLLEDDI